MRASAKITQRELELISQLLGAGATTVGAISRQKWRDWGYSSRKSCDVALRTLLRRNREALDAREVEEARSVTRLVGLP